jgi:hypothetical protein
MTRLKAIFNYFVAKFELNFAVASWRKFDEEMRSNLTLTAFKF